MSARAKAATAAHWTAITLIAFLLTEIDPITGMYAAGSDTVITLGVGLIGLAIAPPRKERV